MQFALPDGEECSSNLNCKGFSIIDNMICQNAVLVCNGGQANGSMKLTDAMHLVLSALGKMKILS